MTIADIKSGGWAVGERLTSTQMGLARTELLKCVDGTGGGVYTPSSTVSITDLTVGGTNRLKYASRTVTRNPVNFLAGYTTDPTRWAPSVTSSRPYWEQPVVGNAKLWFQANFPVGSVLTEVRAEAIGYSHVSVPFTPLNFQVYYSAYNATSRVSLGTSTDPSGSAGAYDAIHTITLAGLSHTVLPNLFYWIEFEGESGAGSLANTRLLSVLADVTMTAQDEWIGG